MEVKTGYLHKPYKSTRDSGLPWLGQIPVHWEVKRLKFVAPASTNKLSDKPDDLPYVGLENIESSTGRLLMETQPESVESNVGIFKIGDILFGKLRPYLAKVVQADFRGCCTTEILALQPKLGIDGRFLFYHLLSSRFIDTVNSMTYGTKMPRASWDQIGNLALSLPPLPEQRAIAAFLDEQTAKIDALIAKKQRLLELLAEQRSALISQTVTKGLNSDAEMKDSGIKWLGKIPEHWKVKRLKHVTNIMFSSVDKLTYESEKPVSLCNYVDVYKNDCINSDIEFMQASASAEEIRKFTLKKDDVMITKDSESFNDIAIPAYVPSELENVLCGYHLALIRSKAIADGKFLFWALKARPINYQFEVEATGITRYGIDQYAIGNTYSLLPPFHEQHAIAAYLDCQTAKNDTLTAKVESAIERLREYRSALISSAVTGKIDVRKEAS